jgi:hypothetical protein
MSSQLPPQALVVCDVIEIMSSEDEVQLVVNDRVVDDSRIRKLKPQQATLFGKTIDRPFDDRGSGPVLLPAFLSSTATLKVSDTSLTYLPISSRS